MEKTKKPIELIVTLLLVSSAVLITSRVWAQAEAYSGVTASMERYLDNCAVCHGDRLEGGVQGIPLAGELEHGDSLDAVVASISGGFEGSGMPAWRDIFSAEEIRSLALYVLETRENYDYVTSNYDAPLSIPEQVFETTQHRFRLETLVADLDPLPFSLAPMPDGSLLLTEKTKGLRIVSPSGEKSALVRGTPRAWDDIYRLDSRIDIERGMGWLFDVALHPDYEDNGWIYLYHSHRCEDCNAISRERERPVSMNRLLRGRIVVGEWRDQQVIWQADRVHYTLSSDVAAGGRIAFDDYGHVYFSVGMKNGMRGIQDLSTPWGKIHRVRYDGSIPDDNPYAARDDAYRSIYTYGHRSPQGLEFDNASLQLWGSEHGPRGGDEINLLLPGRNYGWPLYSLGMDYDGTPVDYGRELGIAFELADIEQPIVDLTPSIAVSSFIIASGERFPAWRGDFIVGSLKARSLFRIEIENNRFLTRETLFEDVGRIRDIEQGFDGEIYLLIEHGAGGQIVRLVQEP